MWQSWRMNSSFSYMCQRPRPLTLQYQKKDVTDTVISCLVWLEQKHYLWCFDRYTFSYSYKLWLLSYIFNLFLSKFVYWIFHGIPPRSLIISRNWPFLFFHLIFISGLNFQQHYPLWPISICYLSMTILGLSYL